MYTGGSRGRVRPRDGRDRNASERAVVYGHFVNPRFMPKIFHAGIVALVVTICSNNLCVSAPELKLPQFDVKRTQDGAALIADDAVIIRYVPIPKQFDDLLNKWDRD